MQQQPTATMFEPARNGNGGTLQLVSANSQANISSAGNLSQSSQKRTVTLKKKRRNKPANLDTIDAVNHSGMLPLMIHGNS